MNTSCETFIEELKDIYNAEQQLIKLLLKMANAAEQKDLRTILNVHVDDTLGHIMRLERVFQIFGHLPRRATRTGMERLLQECMEVIEGEKGDAALVVVFQKMELYGITTYGSLAAQARTLREMEALVLLQGNLYEKKAVEQKLKKITGIPLNRVEFAAGDLDEESVSARMK